MKNRFIKIPNITVIIVITNATFNLVVELSDFKYEYKYKNCDITNIIKGFKKMSKIRRIILKGVKWTLLNNRDSIPRIMKSIAYNNKKNKIIKKIIYILSDNKPPDNVSLSVSLSVTLSV